MTFEGHLVQIQSIIRLIEEAKRADARHLCNKRCKPGEWGGILLHIQSFYPDEKLTEEELRKLAYAWL